MALSPTPPTRPRFSWKHYFKVLSIFIGLILLGYIGYVVVFNISHWDEIQASKKNWEAFDSWMDIYRNDKAGGKTPDETVELFIAALEKNDVDLATSYFMPDDEGSREEERKMMQNVFDAGDFPRLAAYMKKREPDQDSIIGDRFFGFNFSDENGGPAGGVSLQFNGNVWKIEHF